MADNLKFWSIYLLIVGAVLYTGWRQPISYRFMSAAEIYALEHPVDPVAVAAAQATPWMWDPNRKTKLDRGPYNGNSSTGPSYNYTRYNNYNR